MKLDEKSRFLVFCAVSALALHCGVLFFRSLSLYGFDDPREAGFRLAGFVWAMRIINVLVYRSRAGSFQAFLHGLGYFLEGTLATFPALLVLISPNASLALNG